MGQASASDLHTPELLHHDYLKGTTVKQRKGINQLTFNGQARGGNGASKVKASKPNKKGIMRKCGWGRETQTRGLDGKKLK